MTVVSFVLSLYIPSKSVKRTFLKQTVRVLAFSRTLSQPLVYVRSHTCLSVMLIVVVLFRGYLMYLLVCIAYTLPLVAFVFSISFSYADVVGGLLVASSPHLAMQLLVYLCIQLIIVVGIGFVYCFHGK